jgi:uncharacterized phiE125 gp8 family phage protein
MSHFDRITLVTAPTEPVLELDLVKRHLGVGFDDADDLISLYLEAATAAVEGPHGIGVPLRIATYKLTLDAFPCDSITIPLRPVTAISSVQFKDENGFVQTLAPTAYLTDITTGTVSRNIGGSWPTTANLPGAVTITFVAGFETIPADLLNAILLMIAGSIKNREDMYGTDGTATPVMSPALQALLSRYRVTTFG